MSFLDRLKTAATQASQQATVSANNLSKQVAGGSGQLTRSFSMEKECAKAAATLQSFLADPSHPQSALNSIPREVLRRAKGLAIFTVVKVGFVWSARIGSGIVIARLPGGEWSAPSCIGTGGLGIGFQAGADLSEYVIVLNSEEAVKAFAKGGNFTIGGSLSASAGPIGTGGSITSALVNPAPMFSYSKSKGLYAGLSLEGTGLVERKETNTAFYGTAVPAMHLLAGRVPPPAAAEALYDVIESAEAGDVTADTTSVNNTSLNASTTTSTTANTQPLFDASSTIT